MTQDASSFFPEETPDAAPAPTHSAGAIDTLKQAMRRARQDNAERAGVLADIRTARLGRLELLQEALKPLVAQVPPEVDMFDVGLMPGANPRLFIDMIGFVEMGRDARSYCLLQDTRHGRTKIAESEDIDTMVDAVTDYVARRLLERDKALAADFAPNDRTREPAKTVAVAEAGPVAGAAAPKARRSSNGVVRWVAIAFAFLIDLLGSIAFFTILAVVGWYVWNRLHTPI